MRSVRLNGYRGDSFSFLYRCRDWAFREMSAVLFVGWSLRHGPSLWRHPSALFDVIMCIVVVMCIAIAFTHHNALRIGDDVYGILSEPRGVWCLVLIWIRTENC